MDDLTAQKTVAFYQECVSGSVQTRLEHDRSILTLSTAGIGLLVGLLSTLGADGLALRLSFGLATTAFLVAILSILAIFKRNEVHIEEIIKGISATDRRLAFFDSAAKWAFISGIIASVVTGFLLASQQ